ncbi:MAG: dephospho-CoA kinase [Vicinamibacterales bacterium]|jgi:dephospho-CoA kinase|nr:dephospho-CoA kinase [Acidobacteriota bacterium]MDP7472686.1 dephospho-CoA kinase [Vicinamibacterales bacterium]MDP7671944.1 dephospho-CoA kinase [Vicinamibacterales bacterium]HJO39310.1 dephospho-CoA kinase [Vicinamibacterales bacterium]
MLRIALTGGLATGKSHVRARMAALGLPTIDADVIARHAVRAGQPAWQEIRDRFGEGVCTADGTLDRPALAGIVFADADARRDLEQILHPRVYATIAAWLDRLAAANTDAAAVADIPLLYETGHAGDFDLVVVTECDPETQVQRIMARNGLDEAEARRRIAAQLPTAEKAAQADVVISTAGTLDETDTQVDRFVIGLGSR